MPLPWATSKLAADANRSAADDHADSDRPVVHNQSSAASMGVTMGCLPCPVGALCLGNWLAPIAKFRFGAFLNESTTAFYPCPLEGGRSCLPGVHRSPRESRPMNCKEGYLQESPLCSLCDGERGFARSRERCSHCNLSAGTYIVLVTLVVLLWFPVNAYLCESMESLEISFAFLQFLGVYSNFSISWPSPVSGIFNVFSFFTLDIDLMHFACALGSDSADGKHHFIVWAAQTFLPVFYVVLCAAHLAVDWMLYRLFRAGWLSKLLLRGWRPRLKYSWASIRDSYLPRAMLYMHLYYLTGTGKALEPLFCEPHVDHLGLPTGKSCVPAMADHAPCTCMHHTIRMHVPYACMCIHRTHAHRYLSSNPAMTCGEGLHRVMLGLNVVAIVVYVVLSPLTYLFVFFVLVPRHGLANPQLNRNYGFVWSRFEARCYWWEAIELVRKMGVVVVVATVKTAMPQSLLGIVLIGVVFCCSLLLRPFVREIYDAFDSLATATILIFMALGVLLHGNRGGLLSGNVNAREAEAYVTFCTTLAFVSFSVTCVFGVYAVADDLRRILMMRRTRRLRRKTGLALQTSILRLNINSVQLPNPAILEYVESVQDDTQALAELREIERLLQFATTDTQESRQMRDRTEFMERQLSVEPSLADWMLDDRVPNDELRNYMTMAIELRAQSRPKGKVSNVLSDVHDGSIALWLTQLSTSEERALFRKLVMAVDTQMKRPRGRWSKLTANLLMKGRLTASIRSRLHGLFRRSQQVLPMNDQVH